MRERKTTESRSRAVEETRGGKAGKKNAEEEFYRKERKGRIAPANRIGGNQRKKDETC
jgi:hypothetical protein